MKRITTALLALLLALSLSVTGWAEESEIQALPEIREETPVSPEEPEIRETPTVQETSEVRETPEIQESPKPAESPKPQNNPEKTKKKQEPKNSPEPELPTEEPALDKETSEMYAAFFREDAELSNAVIAGILANMQRESGFDPTRIGDNGQAFGLCQWNENRQKRLDALCERASLNRNEISTQQIFMIAELQVYFPDTWMLLNWLEETEDDAAWAAKYICKNYEAPVHVEEEISIREDLAKAYFRLLTDEQQ